MTTNETRDLDRTVAEVMGWTNITVHDEGATLIGDRSGVEECYVPRYSTDPSTQAEKLRWLAARKLNVHLSMWCNKSEPFVEAALDGEWEVPVFGATIDEALARLIYVVAVAKAKKERGK